MIILSVCLAISLFFNGYLAYRLHSLTSESSNTFIFTWGPEEQKIVSGELRMEITFTWDAEDLFVVAKINDDDYCSADYLGLVFDRNKNGSIDDGIDDWPYILFADNTTYPTSTWILHDGRLAMLLMRSQPGNHTCVFNLKAAMSLPCVFPNLCSI
jgi:hypothetical protein